VRLLRDGMPPWRKTIDVDHLPAGCRTARRAHRGELRCAPGRDRTRGGSGHRGAGRTTRVERPREGGRRGGRVRALAGAAAALGRHASRPRPASRAASRDRSPRRHGARRAALDGNGPGSLFRSIRRSRFGLWVQVRDRPGPSVAAGACGPWESAAGHRARMARLPQTALVGILLRDRFGGRVRVDRDGVAVIDYRLSRYDRVHLRRAITAAAEVLEAAGARDIWLPLARDVSYRPGPEEARQEWLRRVDAAGWGPNELLLVTFHQMASCRMGTNSAASVVDPEHRVWGTRGLYVADASTFPSASGVNPMLTVMAMAHRAAAVMVTH